MKKVINLSLVLLWVFIGLLVVAPQVFAEGEKIEVTIVAIFDGTNEVSLIDEPANLYENYVVDTSGINVGYEFAFWIVNGVVTELPESTSFYITETLNAIAVYHSDEKYAVVYTDLNGKLIESQYITKNEASVEPTNLSKYDKIGFTRNGFIRVKGSENLNSITDNTVYKLTYKAIEEGDGHKGDVPIWITNAEESSISYKYNEIVTLNVEDFGFTSQDFSHWEEEGRVVSYDPEYSFTALHPRGLTIIKNSDENAKESKPLVTLGYHLNDNGRVQDGFRAGYVSRVGQVLLPDGYELIEAGYLLSDGTALGELTLENKDLVHKATLHPITNEFLTSFDETQYPITRAYMIVKNSEDVIEEYYSELTKEDKYATRLSFESVIPELNETENDDFYLAGTFSQLGDYNDWVTNDVGLKMEKTGFILTKEFNIILNVNDEIDLQYKYVRGSDTSYEVLPANHNVPSGNRTYGLNNWLLDKYNGVIINDTILKWNDIDDYYINFNLTVTVPSNTNGDVYLAGNFNVFGDYPDWKPGPGEPDGIKLNIENNEAKISLRLRVFYKMDGSNYSRILFKITNGSWDHEASSYSGKFDVDGGNILYKAWLSLNFDQVIEVETWK